MNETDGEWQDIIDECNLSMVAGIILFGTEMSPADYETVRKIQKPLVIYDYEMPERQYMAIRMRKV